ncbi:MAG: hypothetical protein WAZ21_00295 [Candidatus Saccharimonadales bacterium]
MWDLQLANPLGRLSMRKLLSFVAALIVTVFAYLFVAAPTALAADAKWEGQYVQYEGKSFVAQSPAGEGNDRQIPVGDKVYMQVGSSSAGNNTKAFVIYFPASADVTKEIPATYVEYTFNPPSSYSNPTNKKSITLAAQTQQTAQSGCVVEGGLSWIICPVTTTLANGMDWVFGVLRGFLEVQPIQSSDKSTLYRSWDFMRGFANIAFIIGFLIIIYSQITSTGVSNYGIKKLLPRLIIAAILVNVSYYICTIAVDLSNIIGYSLQDMFISVRNALSGTTSDSWEVTSWSDVTGFILSGGTVVGAGVIGFKLAAAALQGAAAGAIYLILPALVSGLLAVLLVIVVLATRQALIVILVVLSPLAMVAYLLPNTEKWFEKWRDLLMTMLIMFPAFSLIFGGSQLAGELIIQSAVTTGNSNALVMVILGMAVQVAPLFITPILFKLSGSLLGRIAGMINNPNKGLVDRTKNWANSRLEEKNANEAAKNRQMAKDGTLRRRNAFRRSALKADTLKRNREGLKSVNNTTSNALFAGTEDGLKLHKAEHVAHQLEETAKNNANIHLQQEINMSGSKLNIDNAKLEASKVKLEAETTETAALMDELKSGRAVVPTGELSTIMNSMRSSAEMVALNGMRHESAKRAWNEDFTNKLKKNDSNVAGDGRSLQAYAGGVQGVAGAQRALASAISAQSKAHSESVGNATTILNHENFTDDIVGDIALNISREGIIVTDDMREAAIMKIAGGANTNEILKLMENIEINASKENQDFRQAFADTLIANSNKPKFAGAGIIADIKRGIAPPAGKARIDTYVAQTINANKIGSADLLVTHDKEYLNTILSTIESNTSGVPLDDEALATIKQEIAKAKSNPLYSGKIGERLQVLNDIDDLI